MSKLFPTLFHKGKHGEILSWRTWTDTDTIYTEYGLVTGKKQISSKIATPKNVGRSNETTAELQAEAEALSMYQFKLDRKYSETPEEAQEELFLPMLAQDFEKHKKNITYPVYVQPKFDGVRCISRWDGDHVVLISRSGKPYNVPHIQRELEAFLPKDTMFDGEIYLHGVSFQELTRLVKKYRPESRTLSYYVYDCVAEGYESEDQRDRNLRRSNVFRAHRNENIIEVQSEIVNNDIEVYEYQSHCLEHGFEGAIVRIANNKYLFGYRSKDLLKVKTFEDAEFRVVGFTCGVGKFANAVIWICETETGLHFNVTPIGTMEDRKEYLDNGEKYVGQMLKVKFFGRSEDLIPRFPVGLGFRLPEDT